MRPLQYAEREVGGNEVFAGVANMVIGFGILTLPRSIIEVTESTNGWVSILAGGLCGVLFAWVVARLLAQFPQQNLFDISVRIVGRPLAIVITLAFAAYMLMFVSYETRGVASISRIYLFDRTPIEAIALVFLLVLIYSVTGPSEALFRLNIIFLPIVISLLLVLIVMNVGFFDINNLRPFLITNWRDIALATKESVFSFIGFEILLFYNTFIKQPSKITKAAVAGMLVPLLLYLLLFLFSVGILGIEVTAGTLYPTIELAKEVEVPGGFFERFESVFFSIWVLSLFCTAAMAFDVCLQALKSVFPKVKRISLVLWLSPLIFIILMQPQNLIEVTIFGRWISYAGLGFSVLIPSLLLLLAQLRGGSRHG